MPYVHVSEIGEVIRDTSTEPCNALLETKEHVIIKLNNNIQGNLSLVNEYICYRIAKEVELNMPKSGIAYFDNKTDCQYDNFEEFYGPCFYSVRVDKTTIINKGVIPYISNDLIKEELILFDHVVYNSDRNLGNLLISMSSSEIFVIDHTHTFKNACIWDKSCFERGMKENDLYDTKIIESNKLVYDLLFDGKKANNTNLLLTSEKYKDRITREFLTDVINDLPLEWIYSKDDINALLEYILYRINGIKNICEVILSM